MTTAAPFGTPGDVPDHTSDGTPDPAPDPASVPAHVPDPVRDHTPDAASDHVPVPVRDGISDATPAHTPDPVRDHTPVSALDHVPVPTPDHAPVPAHTPDAVRDHTPVSALDHVPVPVRDGISDATPDHAPVPVPVRVPDHTPDPVRDHTSDATPDHAPDTIPVPAHTPEPTPAGTPERTPHSAPAPPAARAADHTRDRTPDHRADRAPATAPERTPRHSTDRAPAAAPVDTGERTSATTRDRASAPTPDNTRDQPSTTTPDRPSRSRRTAHRAPGRPADHPAGDPTDRPLPVPDLSLVVLIGTTGAGKSTFARTHFRGTQVLSSDFFRGMVSDDENDQAASQDAFALLHHVARVRLAAGRLTVVDATNVQQGARAQLVQLAREHDVLPVAIVLDVPEDECFARNARREDRKHLPRSVITRQRRDMTRSLRHLEREGFRRVHHLRGTEEIGAARIVLEKRYNDLRHLTGPFDIVGDIHGCRAELEALLARLGYALTRDAAGRAVDAAHPDGRTAVFVGDLVDRGPDTPGVLRLVMGMVAAGHAICVPGNHENKLLRALRGRKVSITHGLAESLAQLEAESDEFRAEVAAFCDRLVSHYLLDGGNLVVAHAGLPERYHGRTSGRVRSFALYGDTTGETDEYGLPVRYPWAEEYRGRATVVYGHTPMPRAEWVNNTICLDTGCVFGGELTALRYPERELVAVPAERVWYEPVRPLRAAAPGGRDGRPLALSDVLVPDDPMGRRVVETRTGGRVMVRGENAAAALEVMSRFAIDPRWLVYLPPTMAPCAASDRPGLLEHPEQAFAQFREDGIGLVMCEEKHMGSRAVALVCRDQAAALDAFGIAEGTGALWTRTGRSFLPSPKLTEEFLGRLRAAVDAAALWDELGTDWLLLDAELMPWSAKAVDLLRRQYAAVGAAAGSALPAAAAALARAAARGVDVADLAARTGTREANARAFTEAYRRYCWPVEGLDGLRFAPFQVLAGRGASHTGNGHDWHLALADRLVAADPSGLLAPTGRLVVDVRDADQVAAGIAWWEELTGAGGEGMVVKPLAAEGDRPAGSRVQPGVKVRGPEYLRIIYGPDYAEPEHLERLRHRHLGHKRSLALREHALGLESLDRLSAGEGLWRVHEPVFAVLALESEPVDPRL